MLQFEYVLMEDEAAYLKKELFEDFAKYVQDDLQLDHPIKVTVLSQEDSFDGTHIMGLCPSQHEVFIYFQKNFLDLLLTAAHELRHAFQFHKGWLKEDSNLTVWKGKKYLDHEDDFPPWEEDAYSYEMLLEETARTFLNNERNLEGEFEEM